MAHSPSDDDDGAASQTAEPQRLPSGVTHSSGSPLNGQSRLLTSTRSIHWFVHWFSKLSAYRCYIRRRIMVNAPYHLSSKAKKTHSRPQTHVLERVRRHGRNITKIRTRRASRNQSKL